MSSKKTLGHGDFLELGGAVQVSQRGAKEDPKTCSASRYTVK
jgi:hypothetical protein